MASIRQEKNAGVIQKELGGIFQKEARTICLGAMVSVTIVRVTPDMGLAKIYLSIFGGPDNQEVLESIQKHTKEIRYDLAQIVRNQLRKTPDLMFYLDDSFDYAKNIDDLLKK